MFKAIACKTLYLDLLYGSEVSLLDKSIRPGSLFLNNSFILKDALSVKILDKVWDNNHFQSYTIWLWLFHV